MTTNYEGKIYKITSNHTNDIYIGSTKLKLNIRLSMHKANYKSYLKGDHNYTSSFEIVKYPDCKIELLELCSFETKEELEAREDVYMVNINCINMRRATPFYKTTLKQKANEKFSCDCGGKYTRQNKNIHLRTKKHLKYLENNI